MWSLFHDINHSYSSNLNLVLFLDYNLIIVVCIRLLPYLFVHRNQQHFHYFPSLHPLASFIPINPHFLLLLTILQFHIYLLHLTLFQSVFLNYLLPIAINLSSINFFLPFSINLILPINPFLILSLLFYPHLYVPLWTVKSLRNIPNFQSEHLRHEKSTSIFLVQNCILISKPLVVIRHQPILEFFPSIRIYLL